MAQAFYESAKRNVPIGKSGHWFHGTSFKSTGQKYWFDAGTLSRSIYQTYSKGNSKKDGVQTYHIAWNHKKAPYGFMVEFGYMQRYEISFDPKTKRFTTHKDRPLPSPRQVAARPFMRPAKAQAPAAFAAGKEVLARALNGT